MDGTSSIITRIKVNFFANERGPKGPNGQNVLRLVAIYTATNNFKIPLEVVDLEVLWKFELSK